MAVGIEGCFERVMIPLYWRGFFSSGFLFWSGHFSKGDRIVTNWQERENLSHKIRSGVRRRRKKGRWIFGRYDDKGRKSRFSLVSPVVSHSLSEIIFST